MPREGTLVRVKQETEGVTGIALSATIGLGVGVMAGMILSELLGDIHSERVKGAVDRLRAPKPPPPDETDVLELAITEAIEDGTENVTVIVQALGNGIVELTGSAADAAGRQLAGTIAQQVPGADVVVNRIQVEAEGGTMHRSAPPPG